MPDSRWGTRSRSSSIPVPALLAISKEEQVSPAAPMSWMPTIPPVAIASRQASIRHFSVKGSPTWTVGRLAWLVLVELGRGEQAGAVDAVAPGLAADVEHRVAEPGGLGEEEPLLAHQAQVEGVHHDVAAVALVEAGLAPDGGDAHRVAVAADPLDHAVQQVAVLGVLQRAEAQRIERGDRPRAHREDVAQDAAHAGRRALPGLDERGVIVALDLEDHGEAVADRDAARVLAGALEHVLGPRGKPPQVLLARLVGAVLGPHHGEDPELGDSSAAGPGSTGCSSTPRA